MSLNFPSNRDQLDPPQPSGPLQDGDAYENAGILWTYNSGLGVWSTESNSGGGGGGDSDELYLSKVNDDTAAGAITAQGGFVGNLTGDVDGIAAQVAVNSKGFDGASTRTIACFGNTLDPTNISSTEIKYSTLNPPYVQGSDGGIVAAGGFYGNLTGNAATASKVNQNSANNNKERLILLKNTDTNTDNEVGNVRFSALGPSVQTDTGKLTVSGGVNAAGDADNYFKGILQVSSAGPGHDTNNSSIQLGNAGLLQVKRGQPTGSGNPCLKLTRSNASSTGDWRAIEMYNHDGSAFSFITIDGSNARAIDGRLGAAGTLMPDGASTIINQLQPKVITQGGETFNGFLPADLTGTFPAAVFGTADATEAIGTLTDYDGTELETEVTEPSAEELTYTEEVETDGVTTATVRTRTWTATGTQAVYQGVDQSKLIPLLTKALQEALERIEVLESAAGGATSTTRKRKS
jgi:hypothetical protein